nr:20S proteasome subunit beta type-3 [Andalucia godoyi]|eukprot:ANDGO_05572.mRNA.1 Proteasome subunit beta type-3
MGDNILHYNGGVVLAMAGEGCYAMASDRRFGVRQTTLACNAKHIFNPSGVSPTTHIALSGLMSDVQTFEQKLAHRSALFSLREDRTLGPKQLTSLVSSMLYEHRFGPYFVEPVIAGLDENGNPYLSGTDLIGAIVHTDDFVVAGTAAESLFGMCESVWRPGLGPEDLFETVSQALTAAVDRDCLSGWGAEVKIVTKDKVITRYLKARMD